MEKGIKKVTKKNILKETPIVKAPMLPELIGESFGSITGVPERVYQGAGNPAGMFSSMRTRFSNLYNGIMPFQAQEGFVTIREAVWLCQKAYFNVAIFRNSITTIADLCNSEIYLEGGNKQSEEFFNAWFKRIGIWKMKDAFFRELFRGGNVFYFRVDGNLSKTDALKINQTYAANNGIEIPLRYVMLNVADIAALNNITYDTPIYYKLLTPQQLKLLKVSSNPDDKEVFQSISKSIKNYFEGGVSTAIPLDMSKIHTIFYQKQDYEPFAVPFGFSVLDDINLKLELKRTDAVLARTVEYAMLLVTQGSEEKPDGTGGTSEAALKALKEMFTKEQIGRVLVADWSTELKWAIPDLNKIMGPAKYQTVNEDIASGLSDIFFGQQKFANVSAKLKVFVEKLGASQKIFLNDFLNPEIKRVAKLMNFKVYPEAHFQEVNLEDPTQIMRIYAQLLQLGIISAEDGLEGISTGELPSYADVLEHQKEFKALKDQGLFQPIISAYPPERVAAANAAFPKPGPTTQPSKADPAKLPGRPPGTKAPQTTKNVGPIGTGSEQQYSMKKLIDVIRLSDKVRDQVVATYKKEKNKKRLTDADKSLLEQITSSLFENELSEDWENKVSEYIKTPTPPNIDRVLEIEDIINDHEISRLAATLLYNSKL